MAAAARPGGSLSAATGAQRPAEVAAAIAAAPSVAVAGAPVAADAGGGRSVLTRSFAALEGFFLEPAAPTPAAEVSDPPETRPVVAVFGVASGCGATVVARALAAELALRDPGGAAAVCCEARPAGIPLATQAAARLARTLEDVPGASPRAVGRLCLVDGAAPLALADTARHHAPLVIDAGSHALGGAPASVADQTVIVTTAATEPALLRVGAACIARVGPSPIVVLNRAPHDQMGALALPNSPIGARLALGGREARGELGRAIAELADLCEEPL